MCKAWVTRVRRSALPGRRGWEVLRYVPKTSRAECLTSRGAKARRAQLAAPPSSAVVPQSLH
eukprot:5004661-Prymnesium_polylepis.1